MGGASISISTPPELIHNTQPVPQDIEGLIATATARRKVLGRRDLEVSDGEHKLSVVQLTTQCCAVPPYQESVDWYFRLEGRLFVANLEYWQGNPDSGKLLEILKGVIQSA